MCPRNEDSQLWPSTWRPGSALSDLVTKLSASRIQPILFMSKALRGAEKRYHTTELEVACLVWTCRKFRPMIQSSTSPVVIAHLCERAIWYEMLRVLLPGGTLLFVVTTPCCCQCARIGWEGVFLGKARFQYSFWSKAKKREVLSWKVR
jgi:hypothetical protein